MTNAHFGYSSSLAGGRNSGCQSSVASRRRQVEGLAHRIDGVFQPGRIDLAEPVLDDIRRSDRVAEHQLQTLQLDGFIDQGVALLDHADRGLRVLDRRLPGIDHGGHELLEQILMAGGVFGGGDGRDRRA